MVGAEHEAMWPAYAAAALSAVYIENLVGLFALVRMGVAAAVTEDVKTLTRHSARSLAAYATDHRAALVPAG